MWKKYKAWYAGLSRAGKVVFISVIAASFMAVAVAAQPDTKPTPKAEPTPTPTITQSPKIEKKLVTEEQKIPFSESTIDDAGLEAGKTMVKTEGVDGTKKITYEVTLTDGKETNKLISSEVVIKQPIAKVFAKGTKVAVAPAPAPSTDCNPNYSGCVPNASDVDCRGGSGNGPAYTGPTRVIGVDVYDLDRDGDGAACE